MRRRPLCVSVWLFVLASASSLAGGAQDASARAADTRNAIVGRVTNASGQPVPATVVTLIERTMTHGVLRFTLRMSAYSLVRMSAASTG